MTRVGAANVAPPPAAPPLAAPPLAAPAPGPQRSAAARGAAGACRRPRGAGPLLILGALAVVAAVVAGALAGQGGDKATPTAAKTASNADLDLQYEAPWAPGGSADAVPGLTLTRPITLRAGDGSIVAGRIAKPGPGLLPAGMTASATDTVSLGVTPAFRHQGVGAKGAAPATVFVVPTDRGPEAIACVGVATSRCEAVAATLHLRAAGALGVEPEPDYAAALGKLLRDQSARERSDRRALGRAATGAAQGSVAASAARAQAALAAQARPLRPGHGARRERRGGGRDRRDRARLQEPRRGGPQAGRGPLSRRERRAAPGARGPRARDQRAEAARLQRPARCMRCRRAS